MTTPQCTHKNKHTKQREYNCEQCKDSFVRPNCWQKCQRFCSTRCRGLNFSKEYSNENSFNFKHGIMNMGYKRINVKGKRILEHRHVMEQHLQRKLESDEIVHHINHDKLDNRIKNLELTNRSEHKSFHHKHDSPKGEDLPQSILKNNDIIEIRKIYRNGGITQTQIGKSYGIGQDHVSKIVNNIYWKHLSNKQKIS